MSDPYAIRREAERIIGEDRVPTSVLEQLVRQYGYDSRAETVSVVATKLAHVYGLSWADISIDHNDPPMDTSNYEGRALTFSMEVDGLDLRVLIEDVTPDYERREDE